MLINIIGDLHYGIIIIIMLFLFRHNSLCCMYNIFMEYPLSFTNRKAVIDTFPMRH